MTLPLEEESSGKIASSLEGTELYYFDISRVGAKKNAEWQTSLDKGCRLRW